MSTKDFVEGDWREVVVTMAITIFCNACFVEDMRAGGVGDTSKN